MSYSEIFVCRLCGNEHEALTQEVGSYLCSNQMKPKGKPKILDNVSLNCLTRINSLSETKYPKQNQSPNGENNYESS